MISSGAGGGVKLVKICARLSACSQDRGALSVRRAVERDTHSRRLAA
jgi:hypothetical protein